MPSTFSFNRSRLTVIFQTYFRNLYFWEIIIKIFNSIPTRLKLTQEPFWNHANPCVRSEINPKKFTTPELQFQFGWKRGTRLIQSEQVWNESKNLFETKPIRSTDPKSMRKSSQHQSYSFNISRSEAPAPVNPNRSETNSRTFLKPNQSIHPIQSQSEKIYNIRVTVSIRLKTRRPLDSIRTSLKRIQEPFWNQTNPCNRSEVNSKKLTTPELQFQFIWFRGTCSSQSEKVWNECKNFFESKPIRASDPKWIRKSSQHQSYSFNLSDFEAPARVNPNKSETNARTFLKVSQSVRPIQSQSEKIHNIRVTVSICLISRHPLESIRTSLKRSQESFWNQANPCVRSEINPKKFTTPELQFQFGWKRGTRSIQSEQVWNESKNLF